jgi:hypothetical protein
MERIVHHRRAIAYIALPTVLGVCMYTIERIVQYMNESGNHDGTP